MWIFDESTFNQSQEHEKFTCRIKAVMDAENIKQYKSVNTHLTLLENLDLETFNHSYKRLMIV